MPGLLRGMARTAVIAGTAGAVVGGVQHRQQQRWVAQEQAQAPQQAAPAEDDLTTQLEQLNNLKNQGLITQDDFDAKKKQLLGL